MNKDKLVELKNATEAKFDTLLKATQEVENDLEEKRKELTRLQGDFRTFEQLIAEFDNKKTPKEGEVIDA